MNRALCALGEAKPPLDNHFPVCQFFGMEVSCFLCINFAIYRVTQGKPVPAGFF